MEENQFLGQKDIGKLMRKYAVPCIISLLVAALYNIVDQIFIANAAYLGSYGNAANTVVSPLTVVALAVASLAIAPAWTGASVACNRLAAAATDAMTASARFASDLPGAGWETEPWSVGTVALWYAALAAFLLWRRARPR